MRFKLTLEKDKIIKIIPFILVISLFVFERSSNLLRALDNNLYGLDPYIFYKYAADLRLGTFKINDTNRYVPIGAYTLSYPYVYYTIYALSYLVQPFIKNPGLSYEEYIKLVVLKTAQIYPIIFSTLSLIFYLLLIFYLTKDYLITILGGLLFLAGGSQFLFRSIAGWADKEPLALFLFSAILYFFVRFLYEGKYIFSIISAFLIGVLIQTWGGFIFISISLFLFYLFFFIKNYEKLLDRKYFYGFLYYLVVLIFLPLTPHMLGGDFSLEDIFKSYSTFFTSTRFLLILFPAISTILYYILFNYLVKSEKISKIESKIREVLSKYLGFPINNYAISFLTILFLIGSPKILSYGLKLAEYKPVYAISTVAESQPITSFSSLKSYLSPLFLYLALLLLALSFFLFPKKRRSLILGLTLVIPYIYLLINNNFVISSILSVLILVVLLYISITDNIDEIVSFSIGLLIFGLLSPTKMIRLIFLSIYAFLIAFPLLIHRLSEVFQLKININKNISGAIFLVLLSIFTLPLSLTLINTVKVMVPSVEGNYKKAFLWLKNNTPKNALIYHWWDYGYWTIALAERRAIVDGSNMYPKRNEEVARYMFNAKNLTELACLFKKYTIPDYILIVSADILKYYQIARWSHWRDPKGYGKPVIIGYGRYVGEENISNKTYLIFYTGIPLDSILENKKIINNTIVGDKDSILAGIYINKDNYNDTFVVIYKLASGNVERVLSLKPKCICYKEKGCMDVYRNGLDLCIYKSKDFVFIFPYKIRHTFFVENYFLNKTWKGIKLVKEFGNLDEGFYYNLLGSNYFEYIKIWKVNKTFFENLISKVNCSFIYNR